MVQELQLSAALGRTTAALSSGDANGAVHAKLKAVDEHFYGEQSEALIRGAPLAAASPRPLPDPVRSRLSARDLIDELQSINTQIHQMMFQVERAVAKLATTG